MGRAPSPQRYVGIPPELDDALLELEDDEDDEDDEEPTGSPELLELAEVAGSPELLPLVDVAGSPELLELDEVAGSPELLPTPPAPPVPSCRSSIPAMALHPNPTPTDAVQRSVIPTVIREKLNMLGRA